ncbi:cytochrome c family protein [Defluviimonas sp. D31]|uniref:c-type cytochrome n=1 Tax=Defluviimonas sp. D31 TaxID=3083253 RepID=UPI00296EAB45|nr:cytochrome c family protein [Defluviimonas sp. D31]MDW4550732.1 cytochrome c family protein [Defluviimonas sp. D31]
MTRQIAIAALIAASFAAPASASGDAAAGEKVFNKCKACHAVGEDAKNKVGPILNGIVGAAAGQVADFKYSDGLVAKAGEGLTWDEETLAAFLAKPKDVVDGTKMSFAGLKKEDEIENVIAYLATFE